MNDYEIVTLYKQGVGIQELTASEYSLARSNKEKITKHDAQKKVDNVNFNGGDITLTELVINDRSEIVEIYKPDNSIDLLQEFEPMALQLDPDGYYVLYSGGKDSEAALEVAKQAKVRFSAHYQITGIDPPEVTVHIKETRKRLEAEGIKLYMHPPDIFTSGPYKGLKKNMWRLIVTKMFPPTRICRYCCDHLKERGGKGKLCVTGVRWEESPRRKNSQNAIVIFNKSKSGQRLFNDNDEGRRQFENCMQKGKRIINPIINWSTADVWEFIREYGIPYCMLYDTGCKRIGCVGCPIGSIESQEQDFIRYPHIKQLYLNAFAVMLEYRNSRGKETFWKTPEEVLEWQMYATEKEQQEFIEGQVDISELEDET
jgi:phosphoadenosine phosphosulfate reductase